MMTLNVRSGSQRKSWLPFLMFVGLMASPLCDVQGADVKTSQNRPLPSTQLYRSWVEKYFETDELWRFENKRAYEAVLDSMPGLNPSFRNQLLSLYKDHLTKDEAVKAMMDYSIEGHGGFVFVPPKLRAKVPRELLEKVHGSIYETYGLLPPLYLKKDTYKDVLTFLESNHLSPKAKEVISNNVVSLNGKFLILANPQTWKALPERFRREVIDSSLEASRASRSLKAQLVIRQGDNLAEVARKYAGERDYRPIERYLKRSLGNAPSVEIPLEKIMHPFIRDRMGTFSECHGPNCFNSGLNVNRAHPYRIENVADGNSLMPEIYSKYRFVNPAESLQAGDLLAYRDVNGNMVHVSSYVGDNIVFTKNGVSKFQPYIFQNLADNEAVYFPNGKFQLVVFRKAKPGEAPISALRNHLDREIVYRQHYGVKGSVPIATHHFNSMGECILSNLQHGPGPTKTTRK